MRVLPPFAAALLIALWVAPAALAQTAPPPPEPHAPRPVHDPALAHQAGGWEGWFWRNVHRFAPAASLRREDAAERRTARRLLAEANDFMARERHPVVRAEWWLALGRSGVGERKLFEMIAHDKKRAGVERESACLALGMLGAHPSLPLLQHILADMRQSSPLRVSAALGIGMIGDPSSTPALVKLLARRDDHEVQTAVALALGVLVERGDDLARQVSRTLARSFRTRDCMRAVGVAAGARGAGQSAKELERLLPMLTRLVRTERRVKVRRAGAMAIPLLRIASPDTDFGWLEQVVRIDADPLVRGYTLLAVAQGGPRDDSADRRRAGQLLVDAAKNDASRIARPFALLGLGLLAGKQPEYRQVLRRYYRTATAGDYRSAAAVALGLSGDRSSRQALAREVAKQGNPDVRGYAAVALALLPYELATEQYLVEMSQHMNIPELRSASLRALALMGPSEIGRDAINRNLKNRNHYTRISTTFAVRDAGGIGRARELINAIKRTANREMRTELVRALAVEASDPGRSPIQRLFDGVSWTAFDESMPTLRYLSSR